MQNPEAEIRGVVSLLTASQSAEIQRAAAQKYLTSDAEFRHPICSVAKAPGSRNRVLGIYQWYRVMSPTISASIDNVTYDIANNILLLDITQTFHIRLSPLSPAPSRLLVRITLREENGLFYIAKQEDFYHPDDFLALIVPPLAPFARMALAATGIASNIFATSAQLLGFWSLDTRERDGDASNLKNGPRI